MRPWMAGSTPVMTMKGVKHGDASSGHHRTGPRDRCRQVQVRLHDRYRKRAGAQRLKRRHRALYFCEKGRARVAAGMAARSLPALAHAAGADMGARPLPEDRLRGSLLLFRAEIDRRSEKPR